MKKLREILRLDSKLAMRPIQYSVKLSLGAVQKALSQAKKIDLTWETIQQLDDKQLSDLFYPPPEMPSESQYQLPD